MHVWLLWLVSGFALRFCAYALALHFTSLLAACCCLLQNNTQLGFFFFKKEDAEAIIAKVRQPGQPTGKMEREKEERITLSRRMSQQSQHL
jgi:hypothetical protein